VKNGAETSVWNYAKSFVTMKNTYVVYKIEIVSNIDE